MSMADRRCNTKSAGAAAYVLRTRGINARGVWRQQYVKHGGRRDTRSVEAAVFVSIARQKSASKELEQQLYVSMQVSKKSNARMWRQQYM
jgi:hypothetical protein